MKNRTRWARWLAFFSVWAVAAIVLWNLRSEGANPLSQDVDYRVEHDGRKRYYSVHFPNGYDRRTPLPVVMVLHGGGGDADVTRVQTRMDEVADQFGFLAVYPEGTGHLRHKLLTWNAGLCCGYAVRKRVDDVGYIAAMLEDLAYRVPIDRQRVYVTGMSNGAMMNYRLGCELSDRIAAIGAVSGAMGVDGPRPQRPMPIIHFHGLLDRNAPYRGGVGANAVSPINHRSVEDTIRWWCAVNGCDYDNPQVTRQREYTVKIYTPPGVSFDQAPAPIVLYELLEGGHTWPGGVDVTERFNTGKLVRAVDASAISWDFFRRFSLAGRVAP